jgi:hypothetical protein
MEYKWIAAKRRKMQKYESFAPFALLCGQFFSRFVAQVADCSVNLRFIRGLCLFLRLNYFGFPLFSLHFALL